MLHDTTARRWVLVVVGALALVGAGIWLVLARVDVGVSDRFADRPQLVDCGRTPVRPGDAVGRSVVDDGREANECFDAAVAEGTGAEVVVESASVEGEPILEYHRALPEGGVEVFVDYEGGGFGEPSLTYFRCPDPQTFVVALDQCEYLEL